jgi:hypothetical protein
MTQNYFISKYFKAIHTYKTTNLNVTKLGFIITYISADMVL